MEMKNNKLKFNYSIGCTHATDNRLEGKYKLTESKYITINRYRLANNGLHFGEIKEWDKMYNVRGFSTFIALSTPNRNKRPLSEGPESISKKAKTELELLQNEIKENKAQIREVNNIIKNETKEDTIISDAFIEIEAEANEKVENSPHKVIVDYFSRNVNRQVAKIDSTINNTNADSPEHGKAWLKRYFTLYKGAIELNAHVENEFKGQKSYSAGESDYENMDLLISNKQEVEKWSDKLDTLSEKQKKLEKDLDVYVSNQKHEQGKGGSASNLDNNNEGPSGHKGGLNSNIDSSGTNPSSDKRSLIDDFADTSLSMPDHFGEGVD